MKVEVKVSTPRWNSEQDVKAVVQMTLDDMYKVIEIKVKEKSDENGSYYTIEYPGYKSGQNQEKEFKPFIEPADENADRWWHNELERKIINSVGLLNKSGINNIFVRADVPNASAEEMDFSFTPYRKEDSTLKAYATVVIGNIFKINSLKIMSSKSETSNIYVSFPSFGTGMTDADGKVKYQDYFYPISAESREKLHKGILDEYNKLETRTKEGFEENPVFGSIDKKLAVFIKGMGATIFYKDGKNLMEFDSPEAIEKYEGTILCTFDEAKYYQELAEKIEKQKEAEQTEEKDKKGKAK